jgi:spermidine/putrescine transport system permease protein
VDLFLQSRNWPFGSAVAVTLVVIMLLVVTLGLWATRRWSGQRDLSVI